MAEPMDDKTSGQYDKTIAQGEQLLNALDFPGAIAKFNKAIKLDPSNARAYFNKAEASVGIPKLTIQDIGQFYEKAIELDPQNPLYYVRFGGFCLDNGLFRRAELCYREAAKLDPENAYLYYSEFAIEFFYNSKRLVENLDGESQKKVSTIAIYYLLRTLNLSKKRAEELLLDLDPANPPFDVFEELEKKEFVDEEADD